LWIYSISRSHLSVFLMRQEKTNNYPTPHTFFSLFFFIFLSLFFFSLPVKRQALSPLNFLLLYCLSYRSPAFILTCHEHLRYTSGHHHHHHHHQNHHHHHHHHPRCFLVRLEREDCVRQCSASAPIHVPHIRGLQCHK
jgi:hypothetical protein